MRSGTGASTASGTLAGSGAPDPNLLVDRGPESLRRVRLVVRVAEPARRVLVQHGRQRRRVAERSNPGHALVMHRVALCPDELHAESGPWLQVAECGRHVGAGGVEVQVPERGDE